MVQYWLLLRLWLWWYSNQLLSVGSHVTVTDHNGIVISYNDILIVIAYNSIVTDYNGYNAVVMIGYDISGTVIDCIVYSDRS